MTFNIAGCGGSSGAVQPAPHLRGRAAVHQRRPHPDRRVHSQTQALPRPLAGDAQDGRHRRLLQDCAGGVAVLTGCDAIDTRSAEEPIRDRAAFAHERGANPEAA